MTDASSSTARNFQGNSLYRRLGARSVTGGAISSPVQPSPLRNSSSFIESIPEHPHEDALDSTSMAEIMAETTTQDSTTPALTTRKSLPNMTIVHGDSIEKNETTPDRDFVQGSNLEDPFGGPKTTPNYTPMSITNSARSQDVAFAPRSDRLAQPITPLNAQGLFPPGAALFVANLSNQRADEQLELSVHNTFNTFGACHIRVRRDRNNQPYAFVQFEKLDDAQLALRELKEVKIDGRIARTEKAKAPCVAAITRSDSTLMTEPEARAVLSTYGPIAKLYPITEANKTNLDNIVGGYWVEFAYYADCRDAINAFEYCQDYYLQLPSPPSSRRDRMASVTSEFQKREESSVFVGNIPNFEPEAKLREEMPVVLGQFGQVVDFHLHRKQYKGVGGATAYNTFAFVQFSTPSEAAAAVEGGKHADNGDGGVMISLVPVRIERKHPSSAGNPPKPAAIPARFPTPQLPTPASPTVMKTPYDMLYEHALQLGLPEWQALRIYEIGGLPPHPFLFQYDTTPAPMYPIYEDDACNMISPTPAGFY